MTSTEYIQAKLNQFGIELSSVELSALLIDNEIVETDDYNAKKAKTAIASIIPEILAKPQISEGGYSIKYDSNSVLAYYNLLCSELGFENKLTPQPKIRNLSNRW